MSEAAPGAAWQRPGLAGEFIELRGCVLPLLDVEEALIRRVFERHGRPVRRFLDVGAGAGAMSELMFGVAPDAEAVLVDYSEPMLDAARARLGDTGSVRIAHADLRDPGWHARLGSDTFDAAVSGLAIHHLDSRRKRELYGEVFDLLEPGAMFVNMDVVVVDGPLHGLFDEEMAARAIAHEHAHGRGRSAEEVERELLADDFDDRPDRADEQLRWLREAGFTDVELHFKWAEAAILGATKPES